MSPSGRPFLAAVIACACSCNSARQQTLKQACAPSELPHAVVVEGTLELPDPTHCVGLDDDEKACRLRLVDGEVRATLLVLVGDEPGKMDPLPDALRAEDLRVHLAQGTAGAGERIRVEGDAMADDNDCLVRAFAVTPPRTGE